MMPLVVLCQFWRRECALTTSATSASAAQLPPVSFLYTATPISHPNSLLVETLSQPPPLPPSFPMRAPPLSPSLVPHTSPPSPAPCRPPAAWSPPHPLSRLRTAALAQTPLPRMASSTATPRKPFKLPPQAREGTFSWQEGVVCLRGSLHPPFSPHSLSPKATSLWAMTREWRRQRLASLLTRWGGWG